MRAVIRRYLDDTGYVVFEAADGAEALEVAARERPDVILLDVQMPRLDGYGVMASLQTDRELSEVPVVLVTARSDPDHVAEGLGRGAHDYLRKPFERPELLARIHAAMRTKALRDELRARNAQLERLVTTDLLTGLFNRRYLEEHALVLASRSRRHRVDLTALLIDVDDLKRVNDTRGHAAGDAVLEVVAERLRGRLRAEDVIGRRGGDEFLVLAPDTGSAGAAALAEDLRAVGSAGPLGRGHGQIPITLSIGWAAWRRPDDSAEALLRRADAALREATAAGGNTVRGPRG